MLRGGSVRHCMSVQQLPSSPNSLALSSDTAYSRQDMTFKSVCVACGSYGCRGSDAGSRTARRGSLAACRSRWWTPAGRGRLILSKMFCHRGGGSSGRACQAEATRKGPWAKRFTYGGQGPHRGDHPRRGSSQAGGLSQGSEEGCVPGSQRFAA
jgi:hypothetical protein